MTGGYEDEGGTDHLEVELMALGEAALPPGFDGRLKTFSEMIAAVEDDDMDQIHAWDAELDEMTWGAFELGLGYLDRGDLESSELWLSRAAQCGVSQAQDKLADLAELRKALAEIDLDFPPPRRDESLLEQLFAERSFEEAPTVAKARESAQAIIDDAHRRARSIVALAELRAQQDAGSAARLTRVARSVQLLWHHHGDIPAPPDVPEDWVARTDTSDSPSFGVVLTGGRGSGKTHILAASRQIFVFIDSCVVATGLAGFQPSRVWGDTVAAATRSRIRSRFDRYQDELMQLYEVAGGDVDGLRRSAGWQLWNCTDVDGGRDLAATGVIVQCKSFTSPRTESFDLHGFGKVVLDLINTNRGGWVLPSSWQQQDGGLVVPSELRVESAMSSAWDR